MFPEFLGTALASLQSYYKLKLIKYTMKKLMVLAFGLGLALTAKTVYAANNNVNTVVTTNLVNDERVALKPEELPEPIKKTLSAPEYKGWFITEAALVKTAAASHYEVSLTKEKETKLVKFDKEGALLK